jgi:sortase A
LTGWILIAIFAIATIHSWLGSSLALAAVASERQPSIAEMPIDNAPVDVSLWSDGRIAAFKEALGIPMAPPIAAIRVPRVGIEVPVFEGTDEVTLNRGAGWIKGTAAPGSDGNSGLAAHRDGFFRALKDVAQGDLIELETGGRTKRYVIRSIEIVDPTNVAPLAQDGGPALTLVTCYPFYFIGSAPQRFIVRATPAAGELTPPGTRASEVASTSSAASHGSE